MNKILSTLLLVAFAVPALAVDGKQALPGRAQAAAAIKAFTKSELIKAELQKSTAATVGQPVVVRLSGMGDACEYMETYLVIQHVYSKRFTADMLMQTSVMAARVEVSTIDKVCAGTGKGKDIVVTGLQPVNLHKAPPIIDG